MYTCSLFIIFGLFLENICTEICLQIIPFWRLTRNICFYLDFIRDCALGFSKREFSNKKTKNETAWPLFRFSAFHIRFVRAPSSVWSDSGFPLGSVFTVLAFNSDVTEKLHHVIKSFHFSRSQSLSLSLSLYDFPSIRLVCIFSLRLGFVYLQLSLLTLFCVLRFNGPEGYWCGPKGPPDAWRIATFSYILFSFLLSGCFLCFAPDSVLVSLWLFLCFGHVYCAFFPLALLWAKSLTAQQYLEFVTSIIWHFMNVSKCAGLGGFIHYSCCCILSSLWRYYHLRKIYKMLHLIKVFVIKIPS